MEGAVTPGEPDTERKERQPQMTRNHTYRTLVTWTRGYGPTHSQSLERFLIGVDNTCTVSLNSLTQIPAQFAGLEQLRCPVILLENKSDYTALTFVPLLGYVAETDGTLLPTLSVHPQNARATVTLLAYGGMARFIADELLQIFDNTDQVPSCWCRLDVSYAPSLVHDRRDGSRARPG